jgi:hypothetical protein
MAEARSAVALDSLVPRLARPSSERYITITREMIQVCVCLTGWFDSGESACGEIVVWTGWNAGFLVWWLLAACHDRHTIAFIRQGSIFPHDEKRNVVLHGARELIRYVRKRAHQARNSVYDAVFPSTSYSW